jgi:putative tricarboxylic transport membrane protein
MAEMFKLASQEGSSISSVEDVDINRSAGVKIVLNSKINLIKSSAIGMIIGTMPGAGASIANFVAYGEAQRSSSEPDSFGRGNPQGLVASESSNNAVVAGSLIPTFAFGIPGSGGTAVLLGALLLHGLQPGPNLFTSDINVTYSVFIALIVSNIIIFVVGYLAITRLSLVTKIDVNYITPVVIVLATVGTLALRNNWIDVATVAVFGIVGLVMVRNNYSIIALVLGVVLGPIVESNLHRSIQLHDTILEIFYSSTIATIMTALIVIMLFSPLIKPLYRAVSAR